MSQQAAHGTLCALHPDAPATWVCGRCGSFMCRECERRTRPAAKPICPACWDLRDQRVAPVQVPSKTALQTAGFVLGFIAILPIPVLIIGSLIINTIAFFKATEPPARLTRWRSVVGFCISLLSIGVWGLIFLGIALFSNE